MKSGILLTVFISIQTIMFSQTTFLKNYGLNTDGDYGYKTEELSSGNYIMLGGKVSLIANEYVGFGILRKLDENGNQIWSSSYLGENGESIELKDFIISSDNNIVSTGTINYDFQSEYDNVYICKFDLNGNIIWRNNYGGVNKQVGNKIIETSDGGFLIIGFNVVAGNANSTSLYAIKVNSNGNLLWEYIQPNDPNDAIRHKAYTVKELPNGDFIICGRIHQILHNGNDLFTVKINSNGVEIWSNIYDYDIGGELRSISLKSNGNILMSGWIAPNFCAKPIILEIDTNGTLLSEYMINNSICEWSSDMHLSINGEITLLSYDNSNYRIVKFDQNFNQLWSQIINIGLNGNNAATTINQTSDGGYIITGTSAINSDIQSIVIKTNAVGIVLSTYNFTLKEKLNIFPNPTNDYVKIENLSNDNTTIIIYNSLGQIIKNFTTNQENINIPLINFTQGIYYMNILESHKLIQTEKLIIK